MNRILDAFIVTALSCTCALAQQSTNIVGTGSETIDFTNLQFSGEVGGNAATVGSVAKLDSVATSYQGGVGGSGSDTVPGGAGLSIDNIDTTYLFGENVLIGGNGGNINGSAANDGVALGGDGLLFFANSNQQLGIESGRFIGGVGGDATGNFKSLAIDGGSALMVGKNGDIDIHNGSFIGGDGGRSEAGVQKVLTAKGGNALAVDNGTATYELSIDGANLVGGTGGEINNQFSGSIENSVDGGSALYVNSRSKSTITIADGNYSGGSGGTAEYNSDSKYPDIIDFNVASDYLEMVTYGASGGHGVRIHSGNYRGAADATLVISNGTFTGGAGGSSINNGSGSSFADGGDGVFTDFADVEIHGGTFQGGIAGNSNLETFDGAGLHVRNGNLTVNGGEYRGLGLLFEALLFDVTATINTGTFEKAIFSNSIFDGRPPAKTQANILGGTFDTVTFQGETINGALLTGGTIRNLEIGGAGLNLSMGAEANVENITQNGGIVSVDQWANHHFTDTTIFGGTMNFNNQIFNLGAGSSFKLLDIASAATFNGGLVAQSNSTINIAYDGISSTTIKGSDLTFEEGVNWIVEGGETVISKDDEVVMAEATGLLNASTNTSFVRYVGAGGSWMGGITALEKKGKQLIGIYGYVSLNQALGTIPGSDFDNAMTDLTGFLNGNNFGDSANYTEFKGMGGAVKVILADAYVRAPEMANTLIQLPGVFANQIKDRTRSYLRQEWGGVASSAPQGAQGPNAWDSSMGWLNDRLPKWDVREAMDRIDPPKASRKIEIPTSYQVWGRAYGSRIEQDATSGFGGYDANIGGGVVGMDKRFNNLLLGLGGGYAHTTVNGNWGSDGEADTGYGTVYAAVVGEKTFFDFNINYAFNDVETEGSPLMQYSGDYKASTVGFYVGGGMGFDWGSVLFTPEASLLTTYYDRGDYTETSSAVGPYPDKQWGAYNEWSYLTSLGATLSMVGQIDNFNLNMEFRPEVRMHWLHEFNAEMDDPTYMMVGGGNTICVSLQSREEDLIKVGTGIRFSKWDSDTLEFGLDIDGAFGKDYAAYMVSGKLMHRF